MRPSENRSMIKWLFLACVSITLLAGCVTRSSEPVCKPTSNTPIAPSTNNYAGTNSQVNITGFQHYDRVFIERIRNKWLRPLDNERFDQHFTGKVTIHFILHSDGTVSDIKITENNVGDVLSHLCEDAIQKCAPFHKWSPAMIKEIGAYRECRFTFYYEN
jgi:outer membrane biosynthesis protein TonB